MATCPKCLGPLTENHKCPRGTLARMTDVLVTAGIGAILGGMIAFAVNDQAPTALVLAFAALGAVVSSAVRQAVVGRR